MRFLSTQAHGILDYIIGAVLIAAPFLFGFATGGAEMWVPILLGAVILVQALMTDYEMGVYPALPMSTHLTVDIVVGLALAVSPWLFAFSEQVWIPHLAVGLLVIGAGLVTKLEPTESRRGMEQIPT